MVCFSHFNFLVTTSVKEMISQLLEESKKLNQEFKNHQGQDFEETPDKKQKLHGIEGFVEKL